MMKRWIILRFPRSEEPHTTSPSARYPHYRLQVQKLIVRNFYMKARFRDLLLPIVMIYRRSNQFSFYRPAEGRSLPFVHEP